MVPLMLLGLGWSLFQSPNLSGMFNAVAPRYVGAVSGLSLTSANIANAMGVAVGSVLFMRWLNFYGLPGAVVPPYTEWGNDPEIFIQRVSKLVDGYCCVDVVGDSYFSDARCGREGEGKRIGVIGRTGVLGDMHSPVTPISSSGRCSSSGYFPAPWRPSATSATPWPALFL